MINYTEKAHGMSGAAGRHDTSQVANKCVVVKRIEDTGTLCRVPCAACRTQTCENVHSTRRNEASKEIGAGGGGFVPKIAPLAAFSLSFFVYSRLVTSVMHCKDRDRVN